MGILTDLRVTHSLDSFYSGGAVCTTQDGQFVVTPETNLVRHTRVRDSKLMCVYGGEDDVSRVTAISLRADDQELAVAYNSLLVKLYPVSDKFDAPAVVGDDDAEDVTSFALRRVSHVIARKSWRLTHSLPCVRLTYANSGDMLVTGSAQGDVRMFHLVAGTSSHNIKVSGSITTMVFTPDDGELMVGTDAGGLHRLVVSESGVQLTQSWTVHSSALTSMVVTDKTVMCVSRDRTISMYERKDAALGDKPRITPTYECLETVVRVEIVPEVVQAKAKKSTVTHMTGGDRGVLSFWTIDGQLVHRHPLLSTANMDEEYETDNSINSITFCALTSTYMVVTSRHSILIVDATSLKTIRHWHACDDEMLDVTMVGKNGKHFALAANDNDVRVYSTSSLHCTTLAGHSDTVLSLHTCAWDNNVLLSAGKDNSMLVWRIDEETGEGDVVARATGHTNSVVCVRASHLTSAFFITLSYDNTVKLWPITDEMLEGKNDEPSECLPTVIMYTVDTLHSSCTVVVCDSGKDVTCVEVAPNDRFVATASLDKSIKLWSVEKGSLNLVKTIEGNKRGVWDLSFSPVDQVIASAGGDSIVRLFSLADGACICSLEGHSAAVTKVLFTSDGKQLVSADGAGLVKLWAIADKTCVKTYEAHGAKIWALALHTPTEGKTRLLSGGNDGQLLLWEDMSEEKREAATAKRTENVVKEQRLNNLIEQERYVEALRLCLTLNRPLACLKVIRHLITDDSLPKAIKELNNMDIGQLLDYVCQWNTNNTHAQPAQLVLNAILHEHSVESLLKMPNITAVLERLLPYTQRHFDRLSRVRQQSTLVHFTYANMKLPDPIA